MTIPMMTSIIFALFHSIAQASAGPHTDHVIVISMDGGKPTVLEKSDMPALRQIMKEGAFTLNAKTIVPSITLPSHTSMLTGVSPAKHGVVWNNYRKDVGPYRFQTIFTVLKDFGKKSAFFSTKSKFNHFKVPGTLDYFTSTAADANDVANQAVKYFLKNKPDFMFLHFPDMDRVGHRSGWGSRRQKNAAAKMDQALAKIKTWVDQAKASGQKITLIITADHGGTALSHILPIRSNMRIPWLAYGAGIKSGHEIKRRIKTYDTAATALWLLGIPVPNPWRGKPVAEVL